jgi:hypothetical protein
MNPSPTHIPNFVLRLIIVTTLAVGAAATVYAARTQANYLYWMPVLAVAAIPLTLLTLLLSRLILWFGFTIFWWLVAVQMAFILFGCVVFIAVGGTIPASLDQFPANPDPLSLLLAFAFTAVLMLALFWRSSPIRVVRVAAPAPAPAPAPANPEEDIAAIIQRRKERLLEVK